MEGRNARSSRLEKEPIARKTKSQVSSILRPVDESFVVLPGGPLGNDSTLLEDENSALSRVFDIASQSTCVRINTWHYSKFNVYSFNSND